MNRNRLLLIGALALALGLMVSVMVYKNLQAKVQPGSQQGGVQVVIAAVDIPVGARIGENDVKMAPFPQDSLPQNCYRQKADVVGQGVVLPITRGEFILPSKLAGKDVSGLPGLIPPGMRAV